MLKEEQTELIKMACILVDPYEKLEDIEQKEIFMFDGFQEMTDTQNCGLTTDNIRSASVIHHEEIGVLCIQFESCIIA